MKRKYKKALQDCFEPPAPQRKAQFLQQDRKSTRLNSSHANESRMPSSA